MKRNRNRSKRYADRRTNQSTSIAKNKSPQMQISSTKLQYANQNETKMLSDLWKKTKTCITWNSAFVIQSITIANIGARQLSDCPTLGPDSCLIAPCWQLPNLPHTCPRLQPSLIPIRISSSPDPIYTDKPSCRIQLDIRPDILSRKTKRTQRSTARNVSMQSLLLCHKTRNKFFYGD